MQVATFTFSPYMCCADPNIIDAVDMISPITASTINGMTHCQFGSFELDELTKSLPITFVK